MPLAISGPHVECYLGWCIAHRSDLAFEAIESTVPEFRHWIADIRGIAAYFRASPAREDDLRIHAREMNREKSVKRFPKFHEIRFAEHLHNLVEALIQNKDFVLNHWKSLAERGTRLEKNQAIGFLKTWADESLNWQITYVSADVLRQFIHLQKEAQRRLITMPDLLQKRDQVSESLKLMLEGPFPGGREESFKTNNVASNSDDELIRSTTKRKIVNSLVTSRRAFPAIRQEIIQSAKEFLDERLNEEQNSQIASMIGVANARNAKEMIGAGRELVHSLFGESYVEIFSNDCIGFFVTNGHRSWKETDSITAKLYEILRKTHKGKEN